MNCYNTSSTKSAKMCWRYRFFFYFCFLIVCIQMFLGYSFYSMNQQELTKLSRWKNGVDQKLKHFQIPSGFEDSHSDSHNSSVKIWKLINSVTEPHNSEQKRFIQQPPSKTFADKAVKRNFIQKRCTVYAQEAISALSRAKTDRCKTELRDITCLSQENKLYPSSLPRSCHVQAGHGKGKHLGCYKDLSTDRDLANFNSKFAEDNSPDTCIQFCLTGSYAYAGLQYKEECWCGHSYGKHGELPAGACATPCPGNLSQTCGGYNAQHIYSTGLPAKISHPVQLVYNQVAGLSPVRIVFVLTVNGRAVRQVKRLVRMLYHPQHYFYIHVDSRNDYMYRELLPLEATMERLRLARRRFASIWGGASLLTTHLAMMRDLLAMADWAWDYYINLSESDYPVKDVESLTSFLSRYKGNNFLKSHGRETPTFIKKNGINQLFYECENHLWRLGKRALPTGIQFDGGSDWLALHRDFCEYAATGTDLLVTGLGELYKYTLLPVESFFHKLLQKNRLFSKWVDNSLHLANWRRKQGCKCQHRAVVDWCGCSPNVFKTHDLDRLMAFKEKVTFFARKFEPIVSQEILNSLDASMGQMHGDMLGLSHYWQCDYHSEDVVGGRTDLLVTVGASLARRLVQQLATSRAQCSLVDPAVVETHLLYVRDTFHRYLVKLRGSVSGRPVGLEGQYSRSTFYRVISPDGPVGRLQNLEVGTDFDLKELIFRNYAGFLGPHSEVALRHVWGQGPSATVSIAFIDPAGIVASFHNITIAKDSVIDAHKPELKTPLRPSVWTVKVLYNMRPVAEVKFLVVPFSVQDGRAITAVEGVQLHNGPMGTYTNIDLSWFRDTLGVDNPAGLMADAVINGKKTGAELEDWIDTLTARFWPLQDTCREQELGANCPYVSPCTDSSWSSLSPDPKSEIIGTDKNGILR